MRIRDLLYELCDAILMVFIANEWEDRTPRTCVLCVDNQAAIYAIVKGSTSPNLRTSRVNLFWDVAAQRNTRRRIEHVHTLSSISDVPSRRRAVAEQATCAKSDGRGPGLFAKTFESRSNLHWEATLFATLIARR